MTKPNDAELRKLLDELAALRAEAPCGAANWFYDDTEGSIYELKLMAVTGKTYAELDVHEIAVTPEGDHRPEDMSLIAAAMNALPQLCAAAEAYLALQRAPRLMLGDVRVVREMQ